MNNPEDIYRFTLLDGRDPEARADLLRSFIDSTGDAVIVHEPDGHPVFASAGASEMLGYSTDELMSLPPFGWVVPGAMRGAPGRLETILHAGRLVFQSRALTKEGRQIPTEVTSSKLDTEEGPLVVAVIRDTTERVEAVSHMAFLAYHDTLTGLANRTAFEEKLSAAITDSRRHGDLLVLAYIDLDHFKPINDRYGHASGDMVLVELAKRLMLTVREQDVVARLGGDEFVVLLRRVESTDEIEGIAQRLLEVIRLPIDACDTVCDVDASIGFAVFDASVDDERSLVVKADHAMYFAKRRKDVAWSLWSPEMGMAMPEPTVTG